LIDNIKAAINKTLAILIFLIQGNSKFFLNFLSNSTPRAIAELERLHLLF
jgi:hypothetical protein